MEDIRKTPGMNYVINTITPEQILKIITDAITDKDISVLSSYYLMGVKAEINKDILTEAKELIDSYKKIIVEDVPIDIKPTSTLDTGNVVSYVIKRPGKAREEVE